MSPERARPIVVIRRGKGHDGHHGGAWKVAYADFVTAMMALFIVLWLLSSDQKTKQAVGAYFKDPTGKGHLPGTTMAGTGESIQLDKSTLSQLKEKLEEAVKTEPKFLEIKDHIQITVTGEGLRIELLESEKGMFFESGSAHPTTAGKQLIEILGRELAKLPNRILVEGHTDAKPFAGNPNYGNWELSSDRAHAARRIMDGAGVRANQVFQVRGYADQSLRKKDAPLDPSNRRVSVVVQYLGPAP